MVVQRVDGGGGAAFDIMMIGLGGRIMFFFFALSHQLSLGRLEGCHLFQTDNSSQCSD